MKKQFKAKVISAKMEKTASVEVVHRRPHPLYKKMVRKTKKYLVDDQLGVKPGDRVIIEECRPLSKKKRFKIVKLIDQQ